MSPRAPAPWPPPPYETGDPVLEPSDWGYPNARSASSPPATSPPDPPPADTDPARLLGRAGITFKEATGAMRNFAGAMQRVGETIGAAFGGVVDSARDFERNTRVVRDEVMPPARESERVYTEAEVSEFDRANEALREAGEESTRHWWRRVGDRYRMVMADYPRDAPAVDEGALLNEDGQPLRLAEERPIGIAVEPGGPGEFVTVQLGGLDENGVPIADRPPTWRENVLLGPRAGHARPSLRTRLQAARRRGHDPNAELFEQLTREGYNPLSENMVPDEALASTGTTAASYELEFRRWRRASQAPHPGPLPRRWPENSFPEGMTDEEMANARRPAERHDDMQDAIVAALRGVAAMPDRPPITQHPTLGYRGAGLRRSPPVGDYNPNTDEIGNGVTHEELQNATTQAQRYDVLWRAGLITGPYDNTGLSKRREEIASPPVVPTDPRKRRLRVRT